MEHIKEALFHILFKNMNKFELIVEKINNDILIAIDNYGVKSVYRQFHTIVEGDLSKEICNQIIHYYENNGWKYADCKSSKVINEKTKNEYNPDRRYNTTGIILKNFIIKV